MRLRTMRTQDRAGSRFIRLKVDGLSSFGKFGRFLVIGLANTAAGFLLFLFFYRSLGVHYLVANMLVFVTWAWFGFELQRRWTFRAKASSVAFGKFLVNQIVFLGFGSMLMWVFVDSFTFRAEFAYLFTIGIVALGMYFSSLLWVFRRTSSSRE